MATTNKNKRIADENQEAPREWKKVSQNANDLNEDSIVGLIARIGNQINTSGELSARAYEIRRKVCGVNPTEIAGPGKHIEPANLVESLKEIVICLAAVNSHMEESLFTIECALS